MTLAKLREVDIRDRSLFIGDLEPVHFKFSVWKKSYVLSQEKTNKIYYPIVAEVEFILKFNEYFSKKRDVSYRLLHRSQPLMNMNLSLYMSIKL